MTRLVFLTDTHLGALKPGYHLQPGYPTWLPELLNALAAWIRERGDISAVLHGGDLLHGFKAELLAEARAKFAALDRPLLLCLGNHDLDTPEELAEWARTLPEYFPGGTDHASLDLPEVTVHALRNHWLPGLEPALTPEQLASLRRAVAAAPDRPHLLLVHGNAYPALPARPTPPVLPPPPPRAWTRQLEQLCAELPAIRLVLTGHLHANTWQQAGPTPILCGSSFVESPFEFKLIEVDHEHLRVSTHSLYHRLTQRADYDFDSTHVQGTAGSRSGEYRWAGHPVMEPSP